MNKLHIHYINKIIDSKDMSKYKEMGDLFIETIDFIKEKDKSEYEDIEDVLYEISEGRVLNEEKAKEIINDMKPYGMHWTLEQTENVRKDNGLTNIRPVDFWIVMNQGYNDYHEMYNENLNEYVMYAKLFIQDLDAREDKVYTYFTSIPKK